MKTKEEIMLEIGLPLNAGIEEAMELYVEQEKSKSRELWIAATQILHLHICEQEGIGSGQPTPKQWLDAVEKLSTALYTDEKK